MRADALSHQGHYRFSNEDAYLVQDQLQLWIVADGIGSMRDAGIASDLIVQPFPEELANLSFPNRIQAIKLELLRRHAFLYAQAQKRGYATGATVAMLILDRDRAAILWAGDSRVYAYFRSVDRLIQLTEDHVSRNAVTRAVGAEEHLSIAERRISLNGDERFLLCSDGLYKKIADEELGCIMKQEKSFTACQILIDLALRREVKDNITVMVVGE